MASYKDIKNSGVPVPPPLKIRYKGTWDMQDFYEGCISWLRERKWKFHEKVYKHKHPSPFGVERQYIWMAEQNVDEWARIVIEIYIHTYDAHDIEVADKEGERKIFTKGKIWITLKISDHWDYSEDWDKSSFWGNLKDYYTKYVVKQRRMQGYSPRYRHELVALQQFMMRKLKMETRDYEYANIAGVHKRGP